MYGDGATTSMTGAVVALVAPYVVLVPVGLVGLWLDGPLRWVAAGLFFVTVPGCLYDLYAARTVSASPADWRWADLRDALVAIRAEQEPEHGRSSAPSES